MYEEQTTGELVALHHVAEANGWTEIIHDIEDELHRRQTDPDIEAIHDPAPQTYVADPPEGDGEAWQPPIRLQIMRRLDRAARRLHPTTNDR